MPLQSLIDAAAAGSTVVLPAGTFRESITIGKKLTVEADPAGTTLDGRIAVTGWQQDASGLWFAAYPYAFSNTSPTSSVTAEQAAGDQCWLGGKQLVNSTKSGLGSGEFSIDRTAKRIYLKDNPSAGVRVSSLARAVTITSAAAGTTLRGLTVTGYASPLQNGQIRVEASNTTLEHVTSTFSAGGGISIADTTGVRLERCTLDDNGHNGYHAPRCDDLTFERCRIGRNNTKNINAWWEAGAGKTVRKARVHFLRCEFYDMHGDGPWWDISAQQALVMSCHIHGNRMVAGRGGKGINFEESKGALFLNNLIENCEGDGVYVNEANGAVIAFNTIRGCGTGVNVSEGNRTNPNSTTDGVKWDAFDTSIQFNRFEGNGKDVYAGHWTGSASAKQVIGNGTWNGNHYASGASIRAADSGGTNKDYATLAAFRSAYPQWETTGVEGASAAAVTVPDAWCDLLGIAKGTKAAPGLIKPPQGPYGADWQQFNGSQPASEVITIKPAITGMFLHKASTAERLLRMPSDGVALMSQDLAVVADAVNAKSVVFKIVQGAVEQTVTENFMPFCMSKDINNGQILNPHALAQGQYTVFITAYSATNGGGTQGDPVELQLQVE